LLIAQASTWLPRPGKSCFSLIPAIIIIITRLKIEIEIGGSSKHIIAVKSTSIWQWMESGFIGFSDVYELIPH